MKYVYVVVFCLLVACQHRPPTVVIREVPVQIASTNSLDAIRFPSRYKAYTVGRRPDPANPSFMHEAHILYVRETPDVWNLHPAPTVTIPESAPPSNSAFTPLPMTEQLRLEVQKQQHLTQSLAEQTQRFQQSTDLLLPAARKAAELTVQVQQRQQTLEERLQRLEEVQRPILFTNWPSLNSTNR